MNTCRRTVIMMLLTALCVPANSWALRGGGAGGIVLGGSKFDLDELDAALVAQGFGKLESSDMSAGIWGYKVVDGRIVIGGQILGSEQVTFNDSSRTSVHVGGVVFNLGYIVYQQSDVTAFPLFGIGVNNVGVRTVERTAAPTFDDVLARPSRESEMDSGGLVLQIGFGVDYLLRLGRHHNTRRGLMLGARVGYTHDPTEGTWKLRDRDVLGGPDVRSSGPFVHFTIGWGRFHN